MAEKLGAIGGEGGAGPGQDYRKYLDPKTLAKVSRLDLVARLVVEGFITGMHQSPYHGFSVEFAEHREYAPGDDIRHMDWKVWGRTDRFYIKQYEEDTNLVTYLVLDTSKSMTYASGPLRKLDYGCFIAASLGYMILNQQDSVGLALFDEVVTKVVPPTSHASHLKLMLHELMKIDPKGDSDIGDVLHDVAERFKRKGLVIVISDFLDDPERILFGLRHLRHRKHEVILFHVLDRFEIDFPFDSMAKFVGLEGGGEELVNPRSIRKAYLQELEAHREALRRGCRAGRIDYVPMDTLQPLDIALTSYLATRSEMKLK